jgi:hypothetical protein
VRVSLGPAGKIRSQIISIARSAIVFEKAASHDILLVASNVHLRQNCHPKCWPRGGLRAKLSYKVPISLQPAYYVHATAYTSYMLPCMLHVLAYWGLGAAGRRGARGAGGTLDRTLKKSSCCFRAEAHDTTYTRAGGGGCG